MKLAFAIIALLAFGQLQAKSWKICYWQDTGNVIDVEPYSHFWTPMELGQKPLPNGRSLKVSIFVLDDFGAEEYALLNFTHQIKVMLPRKHYE